ncbi:hypothetical protein IFM5058_11129, partial [Aspergillus udagawae]
MLARGPKGAGQLVTFARARRRCLDSTTPNPAPR